MLRTWSNNTLKQNRWNVSGTTTSESSLTIFRGTALKSLRIKTSQFWSTELQFIHKRNNVQKWKWMNYTHPYESHKHNTEWKEEKFCSHKRTKEFCSNKIQKQAKEKSKNRKNKAWNSDYLFKEECYYLGKIQRGLLDYW